MAGPLGQKAQAVRNSQPVPGRRKARRLAPMACGAILILGFSARPASAHDPGLIKHYYKGNLVATGQVFQAHNRDTQYYGTNGVEVCDKRPDGLGVYVAVYLSNGESVGVGDSDGYGGSCDFRNFSATITKIKVCINNSSWNDSCVLVNV